MRHYINSILTILFSSLFFDLVAQDDIYSYAKKELISTYDNNLDSLFKSNRFYSVGELYGGKENNINVKTSLILYFYQYKNQRNFFLNNSYSRTLLYNWYLKNGSQELRDFLSYYTGNHEMELLEVVKTINDTLPEGEKIQFIGVDFEPVQVYPLVFKYLQLVTFLNEDVRNNPPEEISEVIKGIIDYDNNDLKYRISLIDSFIDNFHPNYKAYKSVYPNDFESLEHLANNLKASRSIRENRFFRRNCHRFNKEREKIIYKNINYFLGRASMETILYFTYSKRNSLSGFLYPNKLKGTETAVSMLYNHPESPVRGKVIAANLFYYDTFMLRNRSRYYLGRDNYRMIGKGSDSCSLCIIDINNKNSPLRKKSEYKFQYIIVVRPE